jgi:NitT/TauT family transport system substrate-binding protein
VSSRVPTARDSRLEAIFARVGRALEGTVPWIRYLAAWLLVALLAACAVGGESRPAAEPSRLNAGAPAPTAASPSPLPTKLVFALPSVAGVFLPHQLALRKGFFAEEGFAVEMPVTRSNLIAVGLTAGEIDYTGSFGPSVRSALSGLPIRAIAATARASRQIVVAPGIQSVEQLRGQTIAVGAVGDGPYSAGVLALEQYGIDPQQITWVGAGGTSERILAVRQGAAQAVILASIDLPLATSLGLVPLLNLSEIAPFPEAGVTTSLNKLQTERAQVKRVLHALVRGLQYLKSNRDGTIPVLMDYLSLSRDAAEDIYDATLSGFIEDALPSERSLRFAIESDKKQLEITGEVAFAQVADFGPLYEVLGEMGITPAPDAAK